MSGPLRVLIVGDNPDDAGLLVLELSRKFAPLCQRVAAAAEMRAALAERSWDIVLSDHMLPGFGVAAALALCREVDPDLPFVVVADAPGEEVAVALIRAGASDFLLKRNLANLAAVVERNLREAASRRARRRIDREASRLAVIVESSADAILSKTLDGVITSWNPAAERLLGWTATEAIGRHISFIVPPDKTPEHAGVMERLRRGATAHLPPHPSSPLTRGEHLETVRLRKDGTRVDMSLSVSPVVDAGGQLIGAAEIARDVTAEKHAAAVRALLAAIVESAEEAIVSADPDGVVLTWNPAAQRLFGHRAEEAIGQSNFLLLVPPDRQAESRERVERVRQGEHLAPLETVRSRKGGELIHVSVTVSAVRVEGQVVALTAVYRDSTQKLQAEAARARAEQERDRLEQQLRQASKMQAVGQLAGGVAHDFNNLLTIIQGYADLLLQTMQAGNTDRGPVEEIHHAGVRAAALTRQLLVFSRKQVVAPRVLDLNVVVADAEKMLRRTIGEDVRLESALARGGVRVKADAGHLEQVLMNLAVNARDAMPRGGRLTIETREIELDEGYAALHAGVRAGPYALLAVTDTGTGMPAEVRERIFEPFYTTKEVGKGTGLGLAVVHGIVKETGGHVEVYSEVGVGTTFKVYLPRVAEAVRPGQSIAAIRTAPAGTETVLLVEDEAAVRGLARLILTGCGYTVLEAEGGEEAIRLATAHPGPIHLVVTDVVMPGMGGRQVAELVVARHPEAKVLFVSGYADDAIVRHGVLEDEMPFLHKPFSPTALGFKVREVLDSPPRRESEEVGEAEA